jgi:hypothetical protein
MGEVWRPVADVELKSIRGHWFPVSMYVDSGADVTLIPSDFGKLLGMDLSKNRVALAGVTRHTLKVSLQSTRIRIGSSILEARVAVAFRNDVPYLLGRTGIFEAFKINFEQRRLLTRFIPWPR